MIEINITSKLKEGISEIDNLILNMTGGLLPEHLTKKECLLFEEEFGKNWFNRLGYTEPEYKKPIY